MEPEGGLIHYLDKLKDKARDIYAAAHGEAAGWDRLSPMQRYLYVRLAYELQIDPPFERGCLACIDV